MDNIQQAERHEAVEAFAEKVIADSSAAMATALVAIGDSLGLFKVISRAGPVTSSQLAEEADIDERYAREWLGGMASAGYLEYDSSDSTFRLPPGAAPSLAEEGGPYFVGGVHQMFTSLMGILDPLTKAFREGGGVSQSDYDSNMWDGLERFSLGWFNNLLVQEWIPAMPAVRDKLEKGARVADIGCGRGWALIRMAQAFPNSQFVGYDIFPPTIEQAEANAARSGVSDRVTFQRMNASEGLPEKFDVITTFDVVHDSADPQGLLEAILKGLKEDGVYVCLDVNCSEKLEENIGPLGTLFHGFSVLYCMTTSLSQNGEGLGTLGFHAKKVEEMCQQVGFSSVRQVPLENPFNNLYEIQP